MRDKLRIPYDKQYYYLNGWFDDLFGGSFLGAGAGSVDLGPTITSVPTQAQTEASKTIIDRTKDQVRQLVEQFQILKDTHDPPEQKENQNKLLTYGVLGLAAVVTYSILNKKGKRRRR